MKLGVTQLLKKFAVFYDDPLICSTRRAHHWNSDLSRTTVCRKSHSAVRLVIRLKVRMSMCLRSSSHEGVWGEDSTPSIFYTFSDVRKRLLVSVMSVRPSVRPSVHLFFLMEQAGSHWPDFQENWNLSIFRNS